MAVARRDSEAADRPKVVGLWVRVSTEDQARGEAPEHHEKRARLYAEAKGWKVREVYDLSGVSGKSVMEHPETKRMLQDIRKGHITGLIFSKLARLARNTRELLDFADTFRVHGADLISLQEAIEVFHNNPVRYLGQNRKFDLPLIQVETREVGLVGFP